MSDARNCAKCGRNVQAGPGARVSKKGLVHNICPAKRHVAMKMGQRRPARRRQGCRAFKRDESATVAACFQDPRSYISLDNHMLLFGFDKIAQYEVIFNECNPENLTREEGDWHHLTNSHNDHRRCDCKEGGIFIRTSTHKKQHVQVKFQSVPQLGVEENFFEETNAKAI